jgi:lipoprotein-anchoring transpeptidase ErfK/SrfK
VAYIVKFTNVISWKKPVFIAQISAIDSVFMFSLTPFTKLLRKSVPIAGVAVCLALSNCAFTKHTPTKNIPVANETLRMQIFLDGHHFGPGVVDGSDGEFTRKALANYQQSAVKSPDLRWIQPYTNYIIAQSDLAVIGVNAAGPEAQSKQSKMPYTTLVELLAERFHTTQKFMRSLNPNMDLNAAIAGTSITAPNILEPFHYDAYPSGYPSPSDAVAAQHQVIVELKEKILKVIDHDQVIAAFPITPGSSEHPAPVGEWRIVGAVPWPWYRHDEGVLERGERTDQFFNLPPGPNNPVGILWAGLNRPGVGIHGTPVPDTIGRAGSHGCIRLANWDAATFRTLVSKGTHVTIR